MKVPDLEDIGSFIIWLGIIGCLLYLGSMIVNAQTQPKPEPSKIEGPKQIPLDKQAEREEILKLMTRATNARAQIADTKEQAERFIKDAEKRAEDAAREFTQRLDMLRKQYGIDPRCNLDVDLKWFLPGREGPLPCPPLPAPAKEKP